MATVAVPGLDVHRALPATAAPGFEAAVAIDSEGRQWLVQAPTTPTAGAAAESEIAFLAALAPLVDQGTVPFVVPRAAGFAPLDEGGRAVVFRRIIGSPLNLDRLVPGPGAAASLGRTIAAIHELPIALAESTGHPSYTADEYRRRHLAQLDEAATSGKVPAFLLRRWEGALENVALWRFTPVITHGLLNSESVIMSHGQVGAIVDWTDVQVADPANDLAWLISGAPAACVDTILEAYQLARTELLDPHLVDRAQLLSELALAKWLQHGVKTNDPEIIADAQAMMADLVEATTETGTFTVSARVQDQPAAQPVQESQVVPEPEANSEQVAKAAPLSPLQEQALDQDSDLQRAGTAGTNSGTNPGVDFSERSSAGSGAGATSQTQSPSVSLADLEEAQLPDYGRARPPGPHADDATTVMETITPAPDQD